ncbi:hypothetical protein RHGRI_021551 [Rhododendron griersonianum]|uniref:Uncharacterized protein n=1 Tax=Rhododendron griersonianum TaxID=479676 RepID=A0AAV6JNU7_9ERIC|nr:hypothetical protein RHGRI_021551 [Rhododendron griersonianum]
MAKPHALIVPHPGQGHTNPMLKVAKLLHQKGFYITFVVNEYVSRLFLKARGPNALDGLPDFKFAPVPDGIDFGDGVPDTVFFCDQVMKDVPLPFFKKFVDELRSSPEVPPITCILCDGHMTYPLDVAEELGVPCALFWTPSACGFLCYCYFRNLVEQGIVPLKDESYLTNGYLDTIIDIPAMTGIRLRDFPEFVRTTNPEDVMLNICIRETGKAHKGSAIFLNTVDALERDVLDALSTMFHPPVYAIGPLQSLEEKQIPKNSELETIGLNMWAEDLDCLTWLDKKETNSVIYAKRDLVERLVRELMVEEKGKMMKAKALEWKRMAEDAVVAPAGSSYLNFDNLVNEVLLSKYETS